MNTKQTNRWLSIFGLAVGGVYLLVKNLVEVAGDPDVDATARWLVLIPFAAGRSLICLAAAWFIFRRQYQRLCSLLSGVLAMVVLVGVGVAPQMIDLHEIGAPRWAYLVSIPVRFITLLACYPAARWSYFTARSLLGRLIKEKDETSCEEHDGTRGRDFAAGQLLAQFSISSPAKPRNERSP